MALMTRERSNLILFFIHNGFLLFLIIYFSVHIIWAILGGPYFPNDDSLFHIDAIKGVLKKGYPAGDLSWGEQSHKCAYYAHPPLFAYLAAIPALIFGRDLGARIVSCTATTLAMFLLRILGDRYYPGSGTYAAILYGMNPVMFFYASTAQFEPTVCFFGILAMYLITKSETRYRLLAGTAIGCAILTKETGVFFLFPVMIRCYLDTKEWKNSLQILVVSGLCGLLYPLLAWFTCWEAFEEQFLFHFERKRWKISTFAYFIMNDALIITPVLFCGLKILKKDKDLSLGLIGGFLLFYVFINRKYHPIALPLTVPLAILAGKGVQNKFRQPEPLFLGYGYTVLIGYFFGDLTSRLSNFNCIFNKMGYTLSDYLFFSIFLSLLFFTFWTFISTIVLISRTFKQSSNK